jgi:signal transduction histidine kinase
MIWLELFLQDWKNPETQLKWILYMLGFAGILVFFIVLITRSYIARVKSEVEKRAQLKIEYQEQLIENSIDIQEKERVRIAGDLHDNLIAQFYRIHLMNDNKSLSPLIQEGIQTAREISHDLSPPLLKETILSESFERFLSPFQKEYAISFRSRQLSKKQLDPTQKLHLFRIFQEVMINTIKHSQTTIIDIDLRITACYFAFRIQDYGIGFSENASNGLGMKNIELRARQINAQYKFKSNIPSGTRFLLISQHHE